MMTRRYVLWASLCVLVGAWMLGGGAGPAMSEPVLAQAQPTATRPPVPPLATATSVPAPPAPPEPSEASVPTPTPMSVPLMPEAGGADAPFVVPVLVLGVVLVAMVGAVMEVYRGR